MSSKKQTAVEWLISELRESKDFHRVINELNQRSSVVRHILNEAKEMEKEQIKDAYTMGSYDMAEKEFKPEQYYSETYEK